MMALEAAKSGTGRTFSEYQLCTLAQVFDPIT